MIELIVTTLAINYVIFTLGWFSVTCKHWVNLAELHHKHTAEFELKQAEAIIREDAVNLAREIDNLTKKDVPKEVDLVEIKKASGELKRAVAGFESGGYMVAMTTTCYSFADMQKKPLWKLLEPEKDAPINYSNNN